MQVVLVVSYGESFMQLEGSLAFNLIVSGPLGFISGFAFRSSQIKDSFYCLDSVVLSALNLLRVLSSFCICISFALAF